MSIQISSQKGVASTPFFLPSVCMFPLLFLTLSGIQHFRFSSSHFLRGESKLDSTIISTPVSPVIARAGISSPARHLVTASCLDSSPTRNITCRERLSLAALRDTRWGGRFGELKMASVSGAFEPRPQSLPGKRLAVWPSFPSPSKVRSKVPTPRKVCA